MSNRAKFRKGVFPRHDCITHMWKCATAAAVVAVAGAMWLKKRRLRSISVCCKPPGKTLRPSTSDFQSPTFIQEHAVSLCKNMLWALNNVTGNNCIDLNATEGRASKCPFGFSSDEAEPKTGARIRAKLGAVTTR